MYHIPTNMSKNSSVKKTTPHWTRTLNAVKQRNLSHKRSFPGAVTKTLESFCEESTLHGLKNLYESARGLRNSNISRYRIFLLSSKQKNWSSDKWKWNFRSKRVSKLVSTLLWLTACGLGLFFAIVLILLVWDRFQSTPTITTIETNNYPIWNVPVSCYKQNYLRSFQSSVHFYLKICAVSSCYVVQH